MINPPLEKTEEEIEKSYTSLCIRYEEIIKEPIDKELLKSIVMAEIVKHKTEIIMNVVSNIKGINLLKFLSVIDGNRQETKKADGQKSKKSK